MNICPIICRRTDFGFDAALGRVANYEQWHKFGYNADVDAAAEETIWAPGGTLTRMAAGTLSVVSSSASDAAAGVGLRTATIYGIDSNFLPATEVVTLNGTTPVVTSGSWYGVNRVSMTTVGTTLWNVGNITITATSGGSMQAYIPATEGSTQQGIFFVGANRTAMLEWGRFGAEKISGGASPRVTFKCYLHNLVTGLRSMIMRELIDTSVSNEINLNPPIPFTVPEKTCIEFRASTDANDTFCSARFALTMVAAS